MSSASRAAASPATTLRPRTTTGVPLADLRVLAGAPASDQRADSDTVVTGVTLDSRLVAPGDLYVALPGRSQHGARFTVQAVESGAVAVLTDPSGRELVSDPRPPMLVVEDPRRVMALLAAEIYGRPSTAMRMYAVTGTNGKTTTSFLLDAALRGAGLHTGVIGTIGFLLDGETLDATRTTVTTPESPELQALLAVMVERGVQACVMEVSSHALALGRADAITFDVAAFTNFGQDHLDFHGDLESYFEAKAELFTPQRTRSAVVNVDDARGRVLVERMQRSGVPVVTVSLHDTGADYRPGRIELCPDGVTAVLLLTPDREVEFQLRLPGAFNVCNAITALAMLDASGVDLGRAAAGLAGASVPGRMQRVDLGVDAPTVFVDFAHTPQAVTAALTAVAGQRRIVVLGCGGDRDREKRGPIGAAAAREAEVVIVTDDNPRSEDPAAIRREVLSGAETAKQADGLQVVLLDGLDRRSAIRRALALSRPADVVVILGKGHETGQDIAGSVLPFHDVDVVRAEWSALSAAGARS